MVGLNSLTFFKSMFNLYSLYCGAFSSLSLRSTQHACSEFKNLLVHCSVFVLCFDSLKQAEGHYKL